MSSLEPKENPIILDAPSVSSRDPHYYRMLELSKSDMRCLLISTICYGMEAASNQFNGLKNGIAELWWRIVNPGEPTRHYVCSPKSAPTDQILCEEAKKFAQLRNPNLEFAFTLHGGALSDPPNLRGLTNLVAKSIQEKLMASGVQVTPNQMDNVNSITISGSIKSNKLFKLRSLAKTADYKWVQKSIDEMEANIEITQCFLCWDNPMEDERRLALLASLAKDGHILRNATTKGYPPDLWSANEDSEEQLNSLIEEHVNHNFTGPNTTLVLKGPLELGELMQNVVKVFERKKAREKLRCKSVRQTEERSLESDPFDTNAFRKFYRFKCTNRGCSDSGDAFIVISWALPPELWKNWEVKPLDYISMLISNQSTGSLAERLNNEDLGYSLKAYCTDDGFHRNDFVSMFEIQLHLTERGFNNIDLVIQKIFSYIRFLQQNKPSQRLHDEMKNRLSLKFHAVGQDVNCKYPYPISIDKISRNMKTYKSKDLLIAPYIVTHFDETLIANAIRMLVPENANIMLCSCFHKPKIRFKKIEPIYQTFYDDKEITKQMINYWESGKDEFTLPGPNPYLENIRLTAKQKFDKEEIILYTDSKNNQIWVQQKSYHHQTTVYYVHLISDVVTQCPENVGLLAVWYLIIKDKLETILFQAKLAFINYNIQPTEHGFLISVYSWNPKVFDTVRAIVVEIFKKCNEDTISKDLFERKRTEWIKHLCGEIKDIHLSSHNMVHDLYDAVISNSHFPSAIVHNHLRKVQYDDLKNFLRNFCNSCTYGAVIAGNALLENTSDLESLMKSIMPQLENESSTGLHNLPDTSYELPTGEKIIRTRSFSEYAGDVHSTIFYQINRRDIKSKACAYLINHYLNELMAEDSAKMFQDTGSEKINYFENWFYMHSDLRNHTGTLTLAIHCEGASGKYTVDQLKRKIDRFILKFRKQTLACMCYKDFNRLKIKLKTSLYDDHTSASHDGIVCKEIDLLYNEIRNLTFQFNEITLLESSINAVKISQLKSWCKRYFNRKGKFCKKLCIQIEPNERKLKALCTNSKQSSTHLPPKTKKEWRLRRKTLRDCTYKDYHRITQLHKPNKNEIFKISLARRNGDDKQNPKYIHDLDAFKSTLSKFPNK